MRKNPATRNSIDESIHRCNVEQKKPDKNGVHLCGPFIHLSTLQFFRSCTPLLKRTPSLGHEVVLFISLPVFLTEVAEELGRAAAASSVVPYLPRLPILPSKTRTLKKQVENKENIEGSLDATDNSASSSAPGMGPKAGRVRLACLKNQV